MKNFIKKLLLFSLSIIISISLKCQCSGNCHNGRGTYKFENGDKYSGNFKKGLYHGKGTFTFVSGGKYSGMFKKGMFEGEGTFETKDGYKEKGTYKENKMYGFGTATWPSGQKYSGNYLNGKYHGKGIMIFKTGSKYDGDWENGKYHGKGIMIYSDGSKYDGDWENGEKSGKGVFNDRVHEDFNPEGDIYEGEFSDGLENGNGIKYYGGIFQSAKKYEGTFKDGLENGKGKILFENGDFFEGEIFNGISWDEDTSNSSGSIYSSFEGSGIYAYSNGTQYKGKFKRVNDGQAFGESFFTNGKNYRIGDSLVDHCTIEEIGWQNGRYWITKSITISKSLNYLLKEAEANRNSEDFNLALINVNKFLDSLPNDPEALMLRANVYYKIGNKNNVFKDCDRIIEIMNSEPLYKNHLGLSDLDFYYSKRAIYYYLHDDFNLAISDYSNAVELNPNDPDSYYWRANSKKAIADYKGAIADYTKVIELDPNDSDYYKYRGELKAQLKDYNGAIADITKAIELDPNNAGKYNDLSWFIHLSGDSKKALKICNDGININPELPILYITRGEIKLGIDDSSDIRNGLGLNDKFGACEDWQKAKSLGDIENIAQEYLSKHCN
tara:strand:+ start:41 stop:1870 length:1830 start_codon:yes stop_codon:yes gene_type:complete